jgi:hypothetical protein
LSGAVGRAALLAANTPDNARGLFVVPGNLPDGVEILSGLPEKIPGNVVEPPRVHEDQPDNADGFVTRLSNVIDEAKYWVAGAVRTGGMGESGVTLYP